MGSEFTPLPELAKETGVTLNQVRHWGAALGVEVVMVGRVRHVNQDGAGRLREMAAMVASGKTPKEAVQLVASKPEQAQVIPEATTTAVTTVLRYSVWVPRKSSVACGIPCFGGAAAQDCRRRQPGTHPPLRFPEPRAMWAAFARPQPRVSGTRPQSKGCPRLTALVTFTHTKQRGAVTTPASTAMAADLAEIRSAMLTLAQEVKATREENARLREQVSRLVERLDAPPILVEPPAPIRPWEPVRLEPAPVPWYVRWWYELTAPERLRALEP